MLRHTPTCVYIILLPPAQQRCRSSFLRRMSSSPYKATCLGSRPNIVMLHASAPIPHQGDLVRFSLTHILFEPILDLAKHDPFYVKTEGVCYDFRGCSHSGQTSAKLVASCSKFVEVGRFQVNLGKYWPTSGQLWLMSGRIGRFRAKFGARCHHRLCGHLAQAAGWPWHDLLHRDMWWEQLRIRRLAAGPQCRTENELQRFADATIGSPWCLDAQNSEERRAAETHLAPSATRPPPRACAHQARCDRHLRAVRRRLP